MVVKQEKEKNSKRVYQIEEMLALRDQYRDRPSNMSLLDFPHKRRRNQFRQQETEADKFNRKVKEIRITLNKLSVNNFDKISQKILNDFNYTPSLLNELMVSASATIFNFMQKIIFMKSTTEDTFLELYVKLCILLFKKFNDKENNQLNFKKLLISKCQKQFYKLKLKEQEEKTASRRASMQLDDQKSQISDTSSICKVKEHLENDFNKQMLFIFDKIELRYR